MRGLGFGIWGLEFGICGVEFGVLGIGFEDFGVWGFRGLGFGFWSQGLKVRRVRIGDWILELRNDVLGFRV